MQSENNTSNSIETKIPEIVLYDSIDVLPIARHQMYGLYVLQALAIGSSMDDVQHRLSALDEYLVAKVYDKANIERRNLQATFFSMIEKINYHHMAYACLVKKIGDVDYSHCLTESEMLVIHRDLLKYHIKHREVLIENQKKKNTSMGNSKAASLQDLEQTFTE